MKPDILGLAPVLMNPDMRELTMHQKKDSAFDPGDNELSDENPEARGPDQQQEIHLEYCKNILWKQRNRMMDTIQKGEW